MGSKARFREKKKPKIILLTLISILIISTRARDIAPFTFTPDDSCPIPYTYLLPVTYRIILAEHARHQESNTVEFERELRIQVKTGNRSVLEQNDTINGITEEVHVYGATKEGLNALLIECSLQRLPISTHESILPLLLKSLAKINNQLLKHKMQIPISYLAESKVHTGKDTVTCQRFGQNITTYAWTLKVPVLTSVNPLTCYQTTPLYFATSSEICSVTNIPKRLYKDQEELFYISDTKCPFLPMCQAKLLSKYNKFINCFSNPLTCDLQCEARDQKVQPVNTSTVAVTGIDFVEVRCNNLTKTFPVPMIWALLISPSCLCSVEGFEPSKITCSGETRTEEVRSLTIPDNTPSSAPTSVPTARSSRRRQIQHVSCPPKADEDTIIGYLVNLYGIAVFDTILLAALYVGLFWVMCRYGGGLGIMALVHTTTAIGDIQVGPDQIIPDTLHDSEHLVMFIVLVVGLAVFLALLVKKCLC